jgi:hypothetical protein
MSSQTTLILSIIAITLATIGNIAFLSMAVYHAWFFKKRFVPLVNATRQMSNNTNEHLTRISKLGSANSQAINSLGAALRQFEQTIQNDTAEAKK